MKNNWSLDFRHISILKRDDFNMPKYLLEQPKRGSYQRPKWEVKAPNIDIPNI